MSNETQFREMVALIPAAGQGTRLAPLPCSKEIYPVGGRVANGRGVRPKAVCEYLLEKMQVAGVTKGYIIVREGKWDIPHYLGDGRRVKIDLAYLVMEQSPGAPYTLDQAYPFARDALVAFGFPDILFEGDDAFRQLVARRTNSGADVILGLFPADCPDKMDMVDLDCKGRVREILIQPRQTQLRYSWDVAVWTPAFTEFLNNYLKSAQPPPFDKRGLTPELSVGHVLQAAISAGIRVEGVPVSTEPYLDIGTPEGLDKALRRFGVADS